jgi:hypothetical protein
MRTYYTNQLGGGINTMAADDSMPFFGKDTQAQFVDIENWVPNSFGSMSKATGYETVHTSGSATPIKSIKRYVKNNGASRLMYTQGSGLYEVTGASSRTTITTTLSASTAHYMSVMQDRLIICDGVNAPNVWDGTTVTQLFSQNGAGPNVCIGAKGATYSQERLWLWGMPNNDANLVFYSVPNDLTQGYATQFVACGLGDGERITCVIEMFRPSNFDTVLVVFKNNNTVGLITGGGTVANPYTYTVVSRNAGVPGANCAVQFGQNVAYLTRNGVNTLMSDIQNVNMAVGELTKNVKNKFLSLDFVNLSQSIALEDPKNSRLTFLVPEAGNAYSNVLWHYHTSLGCWFKERWAMGNKATSATMDSADGLMVHGDEAGKLYRHTSVFSHAGESIESKLVTPYLSYNGHYRAQFRECAITVAAFGNSTIGISLKYDNGARIAKGQSININSASYTWNGGLWNSDGSYQWVSELKQRRRFWPPGYFVNCQTVYSHISSAGPVQLFEMRWNVEGSRSS